MSKKSSKLNEISEFNYNTSQFDDRYLEDEAFLKNRNYIMIYT